MAAKNDSLGKDDWIMAGTQALADGGLAAVRVEAIARALGITKGSFYWHFANRSALLEAILASWEQRQTLSIIDQVELGGGDALTRLESLSRLASADPDSAVEMTLRDEALRSEKVAEFVKRVDDQRLGYLRRLFTDLGHNGLEAEARSLLCYSLLVGDYFIASGHGALDRKDVLRECRRLLFVPPATD